MPVDHPFAIVPLALVKAASASAVCTYAVLAEAANQDRTCWPSVATIGDRAGQSEPTVRRNINELRNLGWVKVEERRREDGSQTSNVYRIYRTPPVKSERVPPVKNDRPPLSNLIGQEPDPLEPDPSSSKQEVIMCQNEFGTPVEDPFEIWWKQYPRKIRKQAAMKAYRAAAKKVSHQTLMDAMVRYRDFDQRVSNGYAMHGASWLNGECWLEDIEQAPMTEEERQWAIINNHGQQR